MGARPKVFASGLSTMGVRVRNRSWRVAHWTRLSALVLVCLLLGAAAGRAEERLDAQKEALDAVLLLDASGSMLLTDPQRLRDGGAKLFVQLLRSGDRLGVVEFSKEAKVLRPLSSFDAAQGESVGSQIASVHSEGRYTNLLAPLKKGADLLAESSRSEANRVMILLSDGRMEPDPADGTPQALTDELLERFLPDIKTKGIKVYTLSLSDEADKELLSQIALRTAAAHWHAPTADQIHQSFADLFLAVKKPQMLPMTNKGFRIDAEIQEATFYINREGGAESGLISPAGKRLSTQNAAAEGVKWFKGTKFDVVTINNPEAGQWQVEGLPKGEGFVAVMTNLKLETSWPSVVYSGTPMLLEARLYESKKPIVLPEMTGVISYRFKVTPTDRVSEPILRDFLVDDGTNGDKTANDGLFSRRVVIEEPGEYKLGVVAAGPTFERFQQIAFQVRPPLISVTAVSQAESLLAREKRLAPPGEEVQPRPLADEYLRVVISSELRGVKKLEVKLHAIEHEGQDEEGIVVPLTRGEDYVEAPATALSKPGEYVLKAYFTAQEQRGKHLQGESRDFKYTKLPEKKRESKRKPEPVVVKKTDTRVLKFVIFLVLVTLLNAGGFVVGMNMLQKVQLSLATASPVAQFERIDFDDVLSALEIRACATEVDFNAPIFAAAAGESGKKSAAKADSASAAEPPPPEESVPQEEAVAPAPGEAVSPAEASSVDGEGADTMDEQA